MVLAFGSPQLNVCGKRKLLALFLSRLREKGMDEERTDELLRVTAARIDGPGNHSVAFIIELFSETVRPRKSSPALSLPAS